MQMPYNRYTFIDITYVKCKDALDNWNLEIHVIQMAQKLYFPKRTIVNS